LWQYGNYVVLVLIRDKVPANLMIAKNLCRLPNRKCGFVALGLCLVAWSISDATPILIDIGPSPNITTHVGTTFNDLNGTPLQGQTLSLDFLFTNGEFARLFSVTDSQFAVLITLNTTGSGMVGFPGGMGSLLDQTGSPFGTAEPLGSAVGSDGSMSVALVPLRSGQFSTPLDFFGVHTDLMLPTNLAMTVTGGEFQLVSAGANSHDVFGIGPGIPANIVPDSGSTLLLSTLMLLALLALRRRLSVLDCTLGRTCR
jgi:hypothetical protein